MTLVVVERHGAEFSAVEIKTSGDAQRFLVDAWARTITDITEAEKVTYTPDVIVRHGEGRVLEIVADLREENDVIDLLLDDADLRKARPDKVDVDALYLYAVVSVTRAGRLAMIKKMSPAKRAREGKVWALAKEELRLMQDDPWQLHPRFDIVVSKKGAYALSVNGFEQIFADTERLVAKVGDWVDAITARLPMDKAQRDVLVARCEESSRLRRRLRSIENRGHLARVTIARVRKHLTEMKISPSTFIRSGKLVVDQANAGELLQILNEDLFRGGLTDDAFRSEAKEPI